MHIAVMTRCVILALLIALPIFLKAQQSKKTLSDTTKLEEVLVVSSRFPEKKENIAQKVQVVNSGRLQDLNSISTADVLQRIPGIMVQ